MNVNEGASPATWKMKSQFGQEREHWFYAGLPLPVQVGRARTGQDGSPTEQ